MRKRWKHCGNCEHRRSSPSSHWCYDYCTKAGGLSNWCPKNCLGIQEEESCKSQQ